MEPAGAGLSSATKTRTKEIVTQKGRLSQKIQRYCPFCVREAPMIGPVTAPIAHLDSS
jgi:hypothetical protein